MASIISFIAIISVLAIFLSIADLPTTWADSRKTPIGGGVPLPAVGQIHSQDMGCVNFNPYVEGFDPFWGPYLTREVIRETMDILVESKRVSCIVSNSHALSNTDIVELAAERRLKMMWIVYLDTNAALNQGNITYGIELARKYPDTVVAVSCGSETLLRNGEAFATQVISECIEQFRGAGLSVALTVSEALTGWCEGGRLEGCRRWSIADKIDFISSTIFPWYHCIPNEMAVDFMMEAYFNISAAYPDKPVVISEYGHPRGPQGYPPTQCGGGPGGELAFAGQREQFDILSRALHMWREHNITAVQFQSFDNPYKVRST